MDQERYLLEFAGAYVRGALDIEGDDEAAVKIGLEQGLRLHRFKPNTLPRVQKCIGILRGLGASTLLDVGTGRGAFLWSALRALPELQVQCIDVLEHRVDLVNTVAKGGITRISALLSDAQDLDFADDSFDVVTALEVLEHMPNPGKAVRELSRVGKDYLLVSVPSKPDDNPEHINLFSAEDLRELLTQNGCRSAQISHVLNHRIGLGKIGQEE